LRLIEEVPHFFSAVNWGSFRDRHVGLSFKFLIRNESDTPL
jgi:hypothetical protein